MSSSSPVVNPALQWMIGSSRLFASRVPHGSRPSDHLSCFALRTVLRFSLVRRDSHDYYHDSVTMGLASGRPSRVPSSRNVLERRRLPTHVLECPRWASSLGQGVPWTKRNSWLPRASAFRRATDVCDIHPRTLGFRQFGFSLIAQALQSHSLHVFGCSPLYRHAVVPSSFRIQVSRSPRSLCPELRPPPVVILSVRDTAHDFRITRLSSDFLSRAQAHRSGPHEFGCGNSDTQPVFCADVRPSLAPIPVCCVPLALSLPVCGCGVLRCWA